MADLLQGLALHLQAQNLLTYDPVSTSGDCFLEAMPQTPDEAVVLTAYDDAHEPDSKLGYDEPRVQVRVRGTSDPRVSRERCKAIRDELHGLGPITLPDGTKVILSIALQGGPASIGMDGNNRHEHVCNFRIEVRNISTHRV